MEEKIKYVLNGVTKYYTRQELKEYYIQLLKNTDIYIDDDVDDEVTMLIKTLEKYDGDPYGYITHNETKKLHHEIESLGFFEYIR